MKIKKERDKEENSNESKEKTRFKKVDRNREREWEEREKEKERKREKEGERERLEKELYSRLLKKKEGNLNRFHLKLMFSKYNQFERMFALILFAFLHGSLFSSD